MSYLTISVFVFAAFIVLAKATDEAGTKFLEQNAKLEEVVITGTGLQYIVLETGDQSGPSPSSEDTVKVHYSGTLLDGTKFDSSYDRGRPAEFGVRGVIPGLFFEIASKCG